MISTAVHAGESRSLGLRRVVLHYSDGQGTYTSVHRVENMPGGRPEITSGRPMTPAFLRALGRMMQGSVQPEILPPRVICRAAGRVVWWTPPMKRVMFWRNDAGPFPDVHGKAFPQPPLVWRYAGQSLAVRAMDEARHPAPDTPLRTAPYLNVSGSGDVCHGTMAEPPGPVLENLDAWVDAFFSSAFTHHNGIHRLTGYRAGLIALFASLERADTFPVDTLVDARQTLKSFALG